MSPKNAPRTANQDQRRGEHTDKLTIRRDPDSDKRPRPRFMADLTHEEFKALVAEVRGYNRRHPLGYDPREFQGAYYYERGFLSCLIAGAAIPLGITPDTLLIPRHRVILEVVRELAEAGIRGNPEALITWLSKTGTLEKAGGAEYVREIEGMTGIAAALSKFTLEIRRLALERLP